MLPLLGATREHNYQLRAFASHINPIARAEKYAQFQYAFADRFEPEVLPAARRSIAVATRTRAAESSDSNQSMKGLRPSSDM